jgi:hypothetical protein
MLLFFLAFAIISCSMNERKTRVTITGNQFFINGELTYKGRYWKGNKIEGLLFNSRMVQGIFDDLNPKTREKFVYPDTKVWDANRNTSEFISHMVCLLLPLIFRGAVLWDMEIANALILLLMREVN